MPSALFGTFFKSSLKYFGGQWWNTYEHYSNWGLIQAQNRFLMSTAATPERYNNAKNDALTDLLYCFGGMNVPLEIR